MWRMDQQYREQRSEVPWVKRLPSEHIRSSVRLSTQPMSDVKTKDFVKLIEMTESEDVFLFSSDYPHWNFDNPDRVLPPSTVGKALREKILSRNARSLFRFA